VPSSMSFLKVRMVCVLIGSTPVACGRPSVGPAVDRTDVAHTEQLSRGAPRSPLTGLPSPGAVTGKGSTLSLRYRITLDVSRHPEAKNMPSGVRTTWQLRLGEDWAILERLRPPQPHTAVACYSCGGEGFHPPHDTPCLVCNGVGWIAGDATL
jgi:hypothetical protein